MILIQIEKPLLYVIKDNFGGMEELSLTQEIKP